MLRSPLNQTRHTRRDFLSAGTLAVGGLSLSQFLRADEAHPQESRKSAIVILLDGGPSHIYTFDPKPATPSEYRGEFSPISTALPGISFSEHLPRLAGAASRFSLIRGVAHALSDHGLGKQYVLTGTKPLSTLSYPEYAAVMNTQCSAAADLPGSVAIPRTVKGPGLLGIEHAPFETGQFPTAGRALNIPALTMPAGLTEPLLQRREQLRRSLDQKFEASADSAALLDGMDRHSQKAFSILSSKRTRAAFDLSQERPSFASQFAKDQLSQGGLLAIRLVEAGVLCVTITCGGWDTHQNNFPRLKNELLPKFDAGLTALLEGLPQRGLNDSTTVLVTGEFGRSPKINDKPRPGREHYSKCMFMLLAGGNIAGGQVIGQSDETGARPVDTPISPDDVAATFYQSLRIDPGLVLNSPDGRPITLVRDGTPIAGLTGRG